MSERTGEDKDDIGLISERRVWCGGRRVWPWRWCRLRSWGWREAGSTSGRVVATRARGARPVVVVAEVAGSRRATARCFDISLDVIVKR